MAQNTGRKRKSTTEVAKSRAAASTSKRAGEKKQAVKKGKKKDIDFAAEIAGLLIFVLGVFFFLVMVSDLTGLAGEALKPYMFGLFGFTAYAVPVLICVVGVVCVMSGITYVRASGCLYYVGMFLCAACLIELFYVARLDTSAYGYFLNSAFGFASEYKTSAGAVAGVFVYPLYKLLGLVGGYLIFSAMLIILVIIKFRVSLRGAGKRLASAGEKVVDAGAEAFERGRMAAQVRREARLSDEVPEETSDKGAETVSPTYVHSAAVQNEKAFLAANANRKKKLDETALSADSLADEYEDEEDTDIDILSSKDFVNALKGKSKAGITPDAKGRVEVFNLMTQQNAEHWDEQMSTGAAHGAYEDMPVKPLRVETHENVPNADIKGAKGDSEIKIYDENSVRNPDDAKVVGLVAPEEGKAAQAQKPVYKPPDISLLEEADRKKNRVSKEECLENAKRLEDTLMSFGVKCSVNNVSIGPAITRYEMQPAPGVKIARIVSLSNDIALSMAAEGIRIEAPIPGKAAIGVELPNAKRSMVKLREVLEDMEFKKLSAPLAFGLGKDIAGKPVVADLAKMPHTLIAGATGSGKSVCINSIIISILFHSTPEQVRMIMIDPKVVELRPYNGIPHLLIPVVTNPQKAAGALNWAVQEMTRRYGVFAETGARDIGRYNEMAAKDSELEKMPYIIIVIDELADLMMVAPGEIEDSIMRISQLARAAGMHLVVATQRPSVDVITGVIKSNIPSRIAFAVSSQVDSRTILDMAGAEKLLGRGDMLFHPSGAMKPVRLQGCYVDDAEVERVVEYVKAQSGSEDAYDDTVAAEVDKFEFDAPKSKKRGGGDDEEMTSGNVYDPLLMEALGVIFDTAQASASMLQRRLRLGYARAARLVDQMEQLGIVSESHGSKPREILLSRAEAEKRAQDSAEV